MRSTLAALLILALAACGDDGPSRLDIEQVRIAKVSGDQAAIAGTSQATPLASVSASPRLAVTAGETWTPEPLVGRIEAVGARTNGISGPSMLPPDMLAHWHLPEEAGRLLASSTPPDDSLHIVNRWAPSTRAGEYTAVARRILADGSVHEDARWTLVVEPGPAAVVHAPASPVRIVDGQQVPGPIGAVDAYGNAVEWSLDARGSLAVVDGLPRGDGWGRGELDVIVEDTVGATAAVLVYPDLSGPWTVSLVCETPGGTMADVWVSETLALAASHDPAAEGYADAVGVEPSGAARVDFSTMPRRVVIEAGDTIYDTAVADTTLDGRPNPSDGYIRDLGIGAAVISADTTALVWVTAADAATQAYRLPYRLASSRGEDPTGDYSIHGLPPVLPLVGSDPLTWSSDDAVAACHSDGWTDATAGVFTVRADGE